MPRYFFHIHQMDEILEDHKELDIDSFEDAVAVAQQLAQEIASIAGHLTATGAFALVMCDDKENEVARFALT